MAIGKSQALDTNVKLIKQQISNDGVKELKSKLVSGLVNDDQATIIATIDGLKDAGATSAIGEALDAARPHMDEKAQQEFAKDFNRYHPDMKGKDMALFTAATTPKDSQNNVDALSYTEALESEAIWGNMAAADLAGQKKGVLAKVTRGNGISTKRAKQLVADDRFMSRVPVEVQDNLRAKT